jgi:iron(III) transport system ATP-binding protein
VARALVLEPQVLLFDEPLSNLDAKLRRRVREEIRELQLALKLTVAYVTHDQEEALAVSDRIIVMLNAKIAQIGAPRELYEEPVNRFVADFMGDANLIPVEVGRHDGSYADVQFGRRMVRLRHRGVAAGKAYIAVRPHHISVGPRVSAKGDVDGTISKATYAGNHMEYSIAVADPRAELLAFVPEVMQVLERGTDVSVNFDWNSIALVPLDPSPAS